MTPSRPPRFAGWSTRRKVVVALAALAVVVFAPTLLADTFSKAVNSRGMPLPGTTITVAASPAASPDHTATAQPAVNPDPTFSLSGDPRCEITYGSRPDGTMYWTANVTFAGTLDTEAHDTAGVFYPFDGFVTPGPTTFVAPEPLRKIDNIGGILYGPGVVYSVSVACSIAPAK